MEAASRLSDGQAYFLGMYLLRFLRVVVLLSVWRVILAGRDVTSGMTVDAVLTYTLIAEVFRDQLDCRTNLEGARKDMEAGIKICKTNYTEAEGERFADLMGDVNTAYRIGLTHRKHKREGPGDDDGSFVKAGYPNAVGNFGSYPDAYPTYHTELDIPGQCASGGCRGLLRTCGRYATALDRLREIGGGIPARGVPTVRHTCSFVTWIVRSQRWRWRGRPTDAMSENSWMRVGDWLDRWGWAPSV